MSMDPLTDGSWSKVESTLQWFQFCLWSKKVACTSAIQKTLITYFILQKVLLHTKICFKYLFCSSSQLCSCDGNGKMTLYNLEDKQAIMSLSVPIQRTRRGRITVLSYSPCGRQWT